MHVVFCPTCLGLCGMWSHRSWFWCPHSHVWGRAVPPLFLLYHIPSDKPPSPLQKLSRSFLMWPPQNQRGSPISAGCSWARVVSWSPPKPKPCSGHAGSIAQQRSTSWALPRSAASLNPPEPLLGTKPSTFWENVD